MRPKAEDADTSPADPPRDPLAETGGTTHPAQEVEVGRQGGAENQKQRVANTPGWFWSCRPRFNPASEAVPEDSVT